MGLVGQPGTRRRAAMATLAAVLVLLLVGDVAPRVVLYLMYDLEVGVTRSVRSVDPDARVVDAGRLADSDEAPGKLARAVELAVDQTVDYTAARTDPDDEETEDDGALADARSEVIAGGEPIARVHDRAVLERDSTFPSAYPTSRIGVELPAAGVDQETDGFVREGLTHRFPVETEKRSYQYFDPWLMETTYLDYRGKAPADPAEETMLTHVYGQRVAGHRLADTLAALGEDRAEAADKLAVRGPARRFYDAGQLGARGLAPDAEVTLEPYYAVDREVKVEPQSGRVVDVAERVRVYLAAAEDPAEYADATDAGAAPEGSGAAVRAPGGPGAVEQIGDSAERTVDARTLVAAETRWDDDSRATARDEARRTIDTRRALAALAWVCRVLTLVVVGLGVATFTRRGRAADPARR